MSDPLAIFVSEESVPDGVDALLSNLDSLSGFNGLGVCLETVHQLVVTPPSSSGALSTENVQKLSATVATFLNNHKSSSNKRRCIENHSTDSRISVLEKKNKDYEQQFVAFRQKEQELRKTIWERSGNVTDLRRSRYLMEQNIIDMQRQATGMRTVFEAEKRKANALMQEKSNMEAELQIMRLEKSSISDELQKAKEALDAEQLEKSNVQAELQKAKEDLESITQEETTQLENSSSAALYISNLYADDRDRRLPISH